MFLMIQPVFKSMNVRNDKGIYINKEEAQGLSPYSLQTITHLEEEDDSAK